MKATLSVLLGASLLLGAACSRDPGNGVAAPEPKRDGWITGANDDAERFARIEDYLRGFDQPMWEVGARFRSIHDALSRGNFDLATYHWEKIRITIENGVMKRPKREANAKAMFLKPVWQDVHDGFAAKEPARAWAAFERARNGCQGCHEAEKVGYMNDQAVFDLRAPASTR